MNHDRTNNFARSRIATNNFNEESSEVEVDKGGSSTLCSTKTETTYDSLKNYFVEFEANCSKPVVKIEVIHFKIVVVFFDPII